jgi:hypothetical protein
MFSCMRDGAGWLVADSCSGNKESNAGLLGEINFNTKCYFKSCIV